MQAGVKTTRTPPQDTNKPVQGVSENGILGEILWTNSVFMFRRTYRNFELEATRAREGGYTVRIMRKGSVVHVLGGDENGRGEYEHPDIALDWAIDWVEHKYQKARPKYKGGVS